MRSLLHESYRSVSPADVPEAVRSRNALLLDVRSADEYREGHAAGAVSLPLPEMEGRISEIPKDRPVYVICLSGGRSATACKKLSAAGFTRLFNVSGGTLSWMSAGLPTEAGGE